MARKKGTLFGKPKSKVIKHPGAEKKAAKKAGMSTHAYMEKEKNAAGKAGKRARLGLALSKMSKKRKRK
ncbi:MAG: hypothetical protein KGL39_12990 [Patescibacteria group bacterium]|nr:hypothetical protein [Patescibacteria group bacterium]